MMALLAVLIMVAGLVLAIRLSADAEAQTTCEPTGVEIPSAVDDVTLLRGDIATGTPLHDGDTVMENEMLTVRVDWSLKGRQISEGDWFTYQIDSSALGAQAVPVFPITDQATGAVIGCGKVDSSGLMTVVFSDNASPTAAGYAYASARITTTVVDQDTVFRIFLMAGNSVTFHLIPGLGPADIFRKDGWQTVPVDHQYFDPSRGLTWRIVTPRFPQTLHNFHVWDEVPAPTGPNDGTWKHNCAYITGGPVQNQPVSAIFRKVSFTISDGGILPAQNAWKNKLTADGVFTAQNGGGDREAEFREVMDSVRVSCSDGVVDMTVGVPLPPNTQFTWEIYAGFTDEQGNWLTRENISQINGKTYHNVAFLEADEIQRQQTKESKVEVKGGGEATSSTQPTTSSTKPTASTSSTTSSSSSSATTPSSSSTTTPTTTRSTETGNEGGVRGSLGTIGLGSLDGGSVDTGSLGVGSLALGSIATIGIGAWFAHMVCSGAIQIPGVPLPPFCQQPPAEPAPQPTPTEVPTAPGPEEDNGRG